MDEETIRVSSTESVTILKVGNGLRLTVTDSGGSATAYFLTAEQQKRFREAIQPAEAPLTRFFVDGLRPKGV